MIIIEKNNNEKIYVESNEIEEIFEHDIRIEDIIKITIYAESHEIVNNFPFPDSSYKVKINHCHLTQIPTNLPTNTKKLDLSYNDFREINLQSFNLIEILKIKNNRLISVRLPPNLRELHINNNNLANLVDIPDSVKFINICNNLLVSPLENINERCEVVSYNNLYSGGQFFIDYQINIPFSANPPGNNFFMDIPPSNIHSNNFFMDIPPSNIQYYPYRNDTNLTEIFNNDNISTNSQAEYQPFPGGTNTLPSIAENPFDSIEPLLTVSIDGEYLGEEPYLEDTDFLEDEEIKNNYQQKIEKMNELVEMNKITVPENFICPISKCIFYNPVILSDGHTYEKMFIQEWLKENNKSPMTNKILKNQVFSPNILIRSMVREWIDKIENEFAIKNENNEKINTSIKDNKFKKD